jgi:hypothetical protein
MGPGGADTAETRADSRIGVFGIGRGGATGNGGCRVELDFYFVGSKAQFFDSGARRFDHFRTLATTYVCP